MAYSTNDLKTLFNVAPETIRNWTREFARHLSVTANPESGRNRLYTDDDLQVLDLIRTMRENSHSYEEIHAALDSGQRGNDPGVSPEELRSLVVGETERKLALEVQMLRRQLAIADERVLELDALRERNIRLDAEKDAEKRRADELGAQLKASQDKLEGLLREVGRAYHEGYIDALKANTSKSE